MAASWGPTPPATSQPPKRKRRPGVLGWVGIAIAAFVIIGVAATSNDPTTTSPNVTATTTVFAPAAVDTTPAPTAPPATKPPVTTRPKPKLTASQEQAIGTARDYLDTSYFSRTGLIDQLKFEQYSKADATFAVNYLHVDWKEQAVGTARDYLDTSHFSRGGLIGQLKFEGYTTAEAVYAADKVGL